MSPGKDSSHTHFRLLRPDPPVSSEFRRSAAGSSDLWRQQAPHLILVAMPHADLMEPPVGELGARVAPELMSPVPPPADHTPEATALRRPLLCRQSVRSPGNFEATLRGRFDS